MKLGRTLIIGLLFAVVAAVYMYQRHIDKDVMAIIPDEVGRGFSLEQNEAIIRIEVLDRSKKTATKLELSKEGWTVTSPVLYPADPKTADGFATVLRFAAKLTRIRAEKDWSEYGLEKPQLEVVMATDKKREKVLAVGNVSPVGKVVYARWSGERGYVLLPAEIKAVFEGSLYSLLDKRVFLMPRAEIRKVSIEMGPKAYEWKKDGEKWYWFEPVSKFGKEVPPERMELILNALAGVHIKEFLEGEERSKSELGFFMIHDRIKLEGESGDEEIFHFGNEVPVKNAYYGMKGDEEKVFLVDRVNVFRLMDFLRAIENETDAKDKIPSKVMTEALSGA